MNVIETALECYYKNGLTKHNSKTLLRRLKYAIDTLHIKQSDIQSLSYSIRYPRINGEFVVLLDRCNPREFQQYIQYSIIPRSVQQHLNDFHKRVSKLNTDNVIRIDSFKLPQFSTRKLNYSSNRRPQLTKK